VAQKSPQPATTPVDFARLRDVSLALAKGEAPESVCKRILDRVLGLLQAESGAIFLIDDDSWLKLAASSGFDLTRPPQALEGAAVWVAANAVPLLLPDPRRTSNGHDLGHTTDPHDALAVPFLLEGRVFGVLVAMRGRDKPGFGEGHLSLATVLATELALAIERARVQQALLDKLSVAQSQLEHYAVDFRVVFSAEKRRAAELSSALEELQQTYLATVRGMAAAVEAKDEYTAGHLYRVTRYGLSMLELLAPDRVRDPSFEYGFLLHDVGKLGVPDAVLTKPGPLDGSEWRQMRSHPAIGVRIIEGIPFLGGASSIVRSHHERWDGNGYPDGLRAVDIPLGARLFAVADSFDAMTTDRPYRSALSIDHAVAELRAETGKQFWPDAVEALLALPREMLEQTISTAGSHREDIPS
jgi:HD-GYP domain-containing protein (c-di-GMP phosphodiesterase class II)